jgi:hypothetical protein
MKLKSSILVVFLGTALSVVAMNSFAKDKSELAKYQQSPEQLKQTITQAIREFELTPRQNWSYTVSRYESEEGDITSSIEQYDPLLEGTQKWSLLSINGQIPSESEHQTFEDNKRAKLEKEGEQNFNIKLSEIIHVDSLVFLDEDESILRANFRVNLSQLGESATEKLSGTLLFNKQKAFIENIQIVNDEAFSPMFSANIKDFSLNLSFLKIDKDILPHQHALSMKGTFAFFTDIDEESLDTYSDYEFRDR